MQQQAMWKTVYMAQSTISSDTLIHAGNILLPLAVALSGGSATKTLNMFAHMGLDSISLKTFFKHQRVSLHAIPKWFHINVGFFSLTEVE